jgi:small subunit ribosomal protein S20
MPITTSAKKALRSSLRKRAVNLVNKKNVTDTVKKFKKLVTEGNIKEAKAIFPTIQKALDKSAKIGVIKKNAAARKKSRFAALLKKTEAK